MFAVVESLGIPVQTDPQPWMDRGGATAAATGVGLLVADVALPVPSSLVMVAHGAMFGVVVGSALSLARERGRDAGRVRDRTAWRRGPGPAGQRGGASAGRRAAAALGRAGPAGDPAGADPGGDGRDPRWRVVVGILFHQLLAAVIAIGYALFFDLIGVEANLWLWGMVGALIHYTLAGPVVAMVPSIDPATGAVGTQGFAYRNYGALDVVTSFVGHLGFGLATGTFYGLLHPNGGTGAAF